MADYVNWIDFFNLNKDEALRTQQEQESAAGVSADDARTLQGLRDQFQNDMTPNGYAAPKFADYSAYQELMAKQKAQQEAAKQFNRGMTGVDAALGYQESKAGSGLGESMAGLDTWGGKYTTDARAMRAAADARQAEREKAFMAREMDRRRRQDERDKKAAHEKFVFDSTYNALYDGGKGRDAALKFANEYNSKRGIARRRITEQNRQAGAQLSAQFNNPWGL